MNEKVTPSRIVPVTILTILLVVGGVFIFNYMQYKNKQEKLYQEKQEKLKLCVVPQIDQLNLTETLFNKCCAKTSVAEAICEFNQENYKLFIDENNAIMIRTYQSS
jgi:hypothetical protein